MQKKKKKTTLKWSGDIFFRSPGELQERCHFSRWYTGAMQTQLQTDGTLPVALRRDAELTACGDWGAAGETVHQAEPGRGHAGRQAGEVHAHHPHTKSSWGNYLVMRWMVFWLVQKQSMQLVYWQFKYKVMSASSS